MKKKLSHDQWVNNTNANIVDIIELLSIYVLQQIHKLE